MSKEEQKAVISHLSSFSLLTTLRMKMFGIESLPETSEIFDQPKNVLYSFLKAMALQQYKYSFSDKDLEFIKSFEHILVYGAGKIAKKIIPKLIDDDIKNIEIVVTSKNGNQASLYNFPIKEIGSLNYIKEQCVVIVAVGKSLVDEVKDSVAKFGYENIICF